MACELAGARLLMPVFGMSIEVWAAVIATTLGVLSVGYWLGGRIADRYPNETPPALALVLAGMSLLLMSSCGPTIVGLFSGFSFMAGIWSAAAAMLSAPFLLLGMIQPLLVRLLITDARRTGRTVGGLLATSTIGGVSGTIATGLILLPDLGVSKTLLILAVGSTGLGVMVWVACRRWKAACCTLAAVAAAGVAGWRLELPRQADGPMRVIERAEGLYGFLEVLEYHGGRALVCNGVFQAALPLSTADVQPGLLIRGRDYTELVPYLRPAARAALVIGLGGGLHARMLSLYGFDVQAVEIEPAVVRLAEKHFGVYADVTIADGRAFLARTSRRFDAVVLDTFLGGTPPEHLYTREAFERIGEVLEPDGVLAIHLIGRPGHPATLAVIRTLQAVFAHTLGARSGFDDELQHLYLFASRSELSLAGEKGVALADFGFSGTDLFEPNAGNGILLTDDRTCLALLGRDLVVEHQQHSLQVRRRSW
ncbi:MAG TPA: fused MFS/spermidine synthase [Phycisphaerae bacterium]|nr:fused MFS/spermidine synthase [Phycisphaerae bacterium]